jgi:Anti-sigma-28 factor, FlgM
MHVHGPNLLQGPVSRRRGWWISLDDDIMEAMPTLPSSEDPTMRDASFNREPTETERPAPDAPIRADLVERVRREIAEGTYDTPEKWDAALDKLAKRLEEE